VDLKRGGGVERPGRRGDGRKKKGSEGRRGGVEEKEGKGGEVGRREEGWRAGAIRGAGGGGEKRS